jgi:hydroxycarboxylate dehydrogenase B
MPTFAAGELIPFCTRIFEAVGVPAEEARIVSFSLVDSNLCGHDSHGIIRVLQYVSNLKDGKLTTGRGWQILEETPAMLAADGNWGLGQVLAYKLLDQLLVKAETLGIAAGTLRRCGHIGRLGEYAEHAAGKGMALFCTVNSHGAGRRVAPPGGTQGRISTNPLCLGMPTSPSGDSVYLDIGTSAVAEGKVRVHYQKQEAVPQGWLQDSGGKPTTNPAALYDEKARGSILPFGGQQAYKGFGLGLMLDMFAGALSGGECSREDAPMPGVGNCVVFILMNTKFFGGAAHAMSEADKLEKFVRNTPLASGVEAITLPGDPEKRSKEKRRVQGIPIADGTWTLLADLAKQLNVVLPNPI